MPPARQAGRYLPRFSPPLSSAWINPPPPPRWAGIYPFSLGFDVGAIFTSWLGSVEPYLPCTRAAPPCHHPVITALSLLCTTLLQCNAPNIGAFSKSRNTSDLPRYLPHRTGHSKNKVLPAQLGTEQCVERYSCLLGVPKTKLWHNTVMTSGSLPPCKPSEWGTWQEVQ